MRTVAEISVDPDTTTIHEQGWQSWSPSTAYRIGDHPHRWVDPTHRVVCYRAESDPPPNVYNGEGLLAVDPGDGGPVTVIAAASPTTEVPTIRASYSDGRVVVSADGDVVVRIDDGPNGAQGAYARWADQVVKDQDLSAPPPAPTTWCSWYQYFTDVAEADVDLNIGLMNELELPIDVVQVDDGYQQEIGDWLIPSGRFANVPDLFKRITDQGRRAGIWTAPFLVGARSKTFAEHPDWLVHDDDGTPTTAGHNWNQDLFALDTTHPEAIDYLQRVFTTFTTWGID
ncbi:MAG TPA: alpha-galactosidase, partial [Umezawaea sp.]|nr:alpha-galactosidase [Umezawaea sp.]